MTLQSRLILLRAGLSRSFWSRHISNTMGDHVRVLFFGSVITIGGVMGSIVNGKMADLIGRRLTMWVSEFFCITGWFAVAFAPVAWLPDLGRLSMGIGLAIIFYVVTVYIAEITPKNARGGFIAANQAKVGREKQLELALQCLRGKNVNIQHKAAYIRDYTKTFQGHSEARLLDLFKGRYALALIAVAELLLLQQFGGNNAIAFYASSF
ncbi:hypothetical protein GH714_003476 [Hevea brasiliensis]|uniref:Major facilitator superfamily (MFS) profile domain-containing protein n=1 Tax=Hevea brasiliensis TaxID=3981 RepID=A0A6A6KI22_HEVBR|nr:hypothetical protein GH714_003476 [Hevea brasiliensis]